MSASAQFIVKGETDEASPYRLASIERRLILAFRPVHRVQCSSRAAFNFAVHAHASICGHCILSLTLRLYTESLGAHQSLGYCWSHPRPEKCVAPSNLTIARRTIHFWIRLYTKMTTSTATAPRTSTRSSHHRTRTHIVGSCLGRSSQLVRQIRA